MEVIWCQNFTLIVSTVTFSYELYFSLKVAHWITLFELFYLSCKESVLNSCGF
jgi:hypothetical protein